MAGSRDPHDTLPPPGVWSAMEEFLEEWRDNRRKGVTMGSLHGQVKTLDEKLDGHLLDYQKRVTALETNATRDAQDRTVAALVGGRPGSSHDHSGAAASAGVIVAQLTAPPLPSESRRSSIGPLGKALGAGAREVGKYLGKWGAPVLVAGMLGWWGHSAAAPVPTQADGSSHMPTIAQPIPRVVLPLDIPPPPPASASADAGPPPPRRP